MSLTDSGTELNTFGAKKRKPHDIQLARLTPGQRRVVVALIDCEHAPTYREVASRLGLSLGTVYTHLKRIRDGNPEVYAEIMLARRRQLDQRHVRVVKQARKRSGRYFRRRANWRYYQRFGHWPWER